MFKKLLLTSALVAVPFAASAADMAPRSFVKAPLPAPVASWTGLYIGGQVGAVSSANTTSTPDFEGLSVVGMDFPMTQATAGGYVGYDYQMGNIVLGVVGDLNARFGSTTTQFGGLPLQLKSESNWDASIRARAGFLATDRALIYVTGGYGWANYNLKINEVIPLGLPDLGNFFGGTRGGWVVGAGAEYKLDKNWRAKIEYLHADYGTASTTSSVIPITAGSKITSDAVRVGLGYQFN